MAQDAMDVLPCQLFNIPARPPDLTTIENMFHLVGNRLRKDPNEKHL